ADVTVLVRGVALRDDEALNAGQRAELARSALECGGSAAAFKAVANAAALQEWPALERRPALDGLPRLGHLHEHAVLVPHDVAAFAIDLAHSGSVTISGANEPTTSSCPSREQTTPG